MDDTDFPHCENMISSYLGEQGWGWSKGGGEQGGGGARVGGEQARVGVEQGWGRARVGGAGWRSGDSARLLPMWPGFDSWTRRHMWVEFVVGSLLAPRGFSLGAPVFPFPFLFISIRNSRATDLSATRLLGVTPVKQSWLLIYLSIYLFIHLFRCGGLHM